MRLKTLIWLTAVAAFVLLPVLVAFGQEPVASTPEKGFSTTGIESPGDMNETDWSEWLATQMGLVASEVCEVRTIDGSRVDILTATEAIEVEWAKKWKESIGQTLLYSIQTNRKPSIILLSHGDDYKSILRCQIVCAKIGISLRVQRVPKKTKQKRRETEVDP